MAKIEIIVWYSIYRNDWFATSIVQAMLKVHFQWKWQSKIQGGKNDAYCFSSETCGPVQVYLCNEYLSHSIRRKIVERNIMHWTRRKRRSIQCSRLIHTALNFLLDSMLIYNEIHHHNRTEFYFTTLKKNDQSITCYWNMWQMNHLSFLTSRSRRPSKLSRNSQRGASVSKSTKWLLTQNNTTLITYREKNIHFTKQIWPLHNNDLLKNITQDGMDKLLFLISY